MTRFTHKLFLAVLVAVMALPLSTVASNFNGYDNRLPADAAAALHNCTNAVLYSLESWAASTNGDVALHHHKILGKAALNEKQTAVAVHAFEAAIPEKSSGGADCFNPRHALRVQAGGHTYDFVLCYECHYLYVYRDNADPVVLTAEGSPKVLNALLKSVHLPISKTGDSD